MQMCEACSFCLSVGVEDKDLLVELTSRMNNRCPVNLFTQVRRNCSPVQWILPGVCNIHPLTWMKLAGRSQ